MICKIFESLDNLFLITPWIFKICYAESYNKIIFAVIFDQYGDLATIKVQYSPSVRLVEKKYIYTGMTSIYFNVIMTPRP